MTILFPIFFTFLFSGGLAQDCLKGYSYADGNCYKVYEDNEVDYEDAKVYCGYEGAILAEPEDAFVDEFIWNMTRRSESTMIWLGINDIEEEGVFIYDSTGIELNETYMYENWDDPQPDNAQGIEDCVLQLPAVLPEFAWNDAACNLSIGFACQLEPCVNCRICETLTLYDISSSEVTLDWSRPCPEWPVLKYHIDFVVHKEQGFKEYSQDYECITDTCANNDVSGLRSCIEYEVQLNAYQNGGFESSVAYERSTFETLPAFPSNVNNLRPVSVTSENITLEWNHPSLHKECTLTYHICYQIISGNRLGKSVQTCVESPPVDDFSGAYNYFLTGLEPCALYYVTVQPNSALGLGPAAPIEVKMLVADPGTPENFKAATLNSTCLTLSWDRPKVNSFCASGYSRTCTEKQAKEVIQPHAAFSEVYCGLEPCTDYTCEVKSVGVSGASDSAAATASNTTSIDNPPTEPNSLGISFVTETSLYMTWSRPDTGYHCMDGYEVSYTNFNVTDFGISPLPLNTISYTLSNLLPCSYYRAEVYGVTPYGIDGLSAVDAATTLDVPPETPTNLRVAIIECRKLEFCWDLPYNNPQCVHNYDTDFHPVVSKNEGTNAAINVESRQNGEFDYCLIFDNLTPDTEYYFEVWFLAQDGQIGPSNALISKTFPICI